MELNKLIYPYGCSLLSAFINFHVLSYFIEAALCHTSNSPFNLYVFYKKHNQSKVAKCVIINLKLLIGNNLISQIRSLIEFYEE